VIYRIPVLLHCFRKRNQLVAFLLTRSTHTCMDQEVMTQCAGWYTELFYYLYI